MSDQHNRHQQPHQNAGTPAKTEQAPKSGAMQELSTTRANYRTALDEFKVAREKVISTRNAFKKVNAGQRDAIRAEREAVKAAKAKEKADAKAAKQAERDKAKAEKQAEREAAKQKAAAEKANAEKAAA